MLEKTGDNNTREVYSFIEKVRNNQKINIKEFRKVMPIVQEMFVNHEKSMVGKILNMLTDTKAVQLTFNSV